MKEELIDESELGTSPSPTHMSSGNTFDNPVYDEIKIDLGSEMVKGPPLEDVPPPAPAEMNVYEDNSILSPPANDEDEKRAPKLNEYERL